MTDTRRIRKKCHQCGRVMNSNSIKKHYRDKHKLDVTGNLQFLIKLTNFRLFKTDSYPNLKVILTLIWKFCLILGKKLTDICDTVNENERQLFVKVKNINDSSERKLNLYFRLPDGALQSFSKDIKWIINRPIILALVKS